MWNKSRFAVEPESHMILCYISSVPCVTNVAHYYFVLNSEAESAIDFIHCDVKGKICKQIHRKKNM